MFLSSPSIILSDTHHSKIHNVRWNVGEESRWEYSTHGWSYTLEEMKEIYEKEYEEGTRLENYVRLEDGKYIGSLYGKEFEVPEKFIKTTLSHLEQMLEKKWTKYIFRLDAFHCHPFVPDDVFDKEYGDVNHADLIAKYINDDRLGALYHNTEHLALRNPPKTGEIDPEAQELISKRSVLGWYDGRPLEQTHPGEDEPQGRREANTADVPDGYHNVGFVTFKATKNGEFSITHPNGEEIRIDISFDADSYY